MADPDVFGSSNVTSSLISQSPIGSSSVFGSSNVTPSLISQSPIGSSSPFDSSFTSNASSTHFPGFNADPSVGFHLDFGDADVKQARSHVRKLLKVKLRTRSSSRPSSALNQSPTSPLPPPPPATTTTTTTVPVENPLATVSETPTKYTFTLASSQSAEETDDPRIHLELMVDKKSNRVLFAESKNDLIDLLFSFLTLPIGSIVKMMKELPQSSSIGCMNNIHKSVENLESKFFMTETCKELLISPERSSEAEYNNLKLKIAEDLGPSKCFYFCEDSECKRVTLRLSEFPNVRCHCGQMMSQSAKENVIRKAHDDGEGVFVKGITDMFLVSDDLQVMTGSTSLSLSLLKKSGITDVNEVETQSISIGPQEVLQLLHLTLVSKTPLTDLIRPKQGDLDKPELHLENTTIESPDEKSDASKSKVVSLKLFISKSKEKVLYAECGEDFVDFLFSFLTFPLGSIVQLFDVSSSLLGIDNLYKSVKDLDSKHYIKSERLKNMLIKPKLAPFHACENQLLDFEESFFPLYELYCLDSRTKWSVSPVTTTNSEHATYPQAELGQFAVMNPKCPNGGTSCGGGFVKGPARFMVTDGLDVMQLSAISSIAILAKSNVPVSDVDATVIDLGKDEALNLLKASLVSETPLSDLFNRKCKKIVE